MRTLRTRLCPFVLVACWAIVLSGPAQAKEPKEPKAKKTVKCCQPVAIPLRTTALHTTNTTTLTSTTDFFCPIFAMMDWGSYKTWVGNTGSNTDDAYDCMTMMVDIAGDPPYGGNCAGDGTGCITLVSGAPAPPPPRSGYPKTSDEKQSKTTTVSTVATLTSNSYTVMGEVGYPFDRLPVRDPQTDPPPDGNPNGNGKVVRNFIPGLSQVIRFQYTDGDGMTQTIDAQIFVANLKHKNKHMVGGRGNEVETQAEEPDTVFELGDEGAPVPVPDKPHKFLYAVRVNPNFTLHVPITTNHATPGHDQ